MSVGTTQLRITSSPLVCGQARKNFTGPSTASAQKDNKLKNSQINANFLKINYLLLPTTVVNTSFLFKYLLDNNLTSLALTDKILRIKSL